MATQLKSKKFFLMQEYGQNAMPQVHQTQMKSLMDVIPDEAQLWNDPQKWDGKNWPNRDPKKDGTLGNPKQILIKSDSGTINIIGDYFSRGQQRQRLILRLARGATGRDKIIKFEGCYHGHSDSLLIKAGSGALTFGVPSSPGVPDVLAQHTVTLPFNDLDALKEAFDQLGAEIACVITEPVTGNMNCILPEPGYLEGMRELCTEHGAILIFDEVMTGFRFGTHCAQGHLGIDPDLTCLGKVIGGGMPVGAFGGKKDIMAHISPLGPVYQAGTLSGNPVAMASGLATLDIISQPTFYDDLFRHTTELCEGMQQVADEAGIPFTTNHMGSMFGFFFTEDEKVTQYPQVIGANVERFNKFFHLMLNEGVYLAPASFEAGFMSSAHTDGDIADTIDAARRAFKAL